MTVRQAKLDQASRYNCGRDLAKRRRRGKRHRRWEAEDRMVPHIEHIHTELELMAFLKVESLLHGKVPILLERTTESISWGVAISGCSRPCEVGNIIRRDVPAADV